MPYRHAMPARVDPLFPDCCYVCAHHERATGTCDHDFSQLLRREFVDDPDRPCPVGDWKEP